MYCTSDQVYVSKDCYFLDMMSMRSPLFRGITQRRLLVSYRRFWTTNMYLDP